jgi:hypothetical protein
MLSLCDATQFLITSASDKIHTKGDSWCKKYNAHNAEVVNKKDNIIVESFPSIDVKYNMDCYNYQSILENSDITAHVLLS